MKETLSENKVFFLLLVGLTASFLIFLVGFRFSYVNQDGPLTTPTLVQIPEGTGVNETGKLLANEGVISFTAGNFRLFQLAYYLTYPTQSLKAGEYEFAANSSLNDIFKKLTSGDIYYRKLTVPEGLTTSQIFQLLNESVGLTGDLPGDVTEGELLPETYNYTFGDTRVDLVKRMYKKRRELIDSLWPTLPTDSPIRTIEQAITLASIIEKETSIASERPVVAGVYLNRLRKGMKLQADPTVVYGITMGTRDLGRALTLNDLQKDTPYNTYTRTGLPPGPICHPGAESIKAVFKPANTKYLYFVADGNGGHKFANTVDEHNRNVRAYRLQKAKAKSSVRKPQ